VTLEDEGAAFFRNVGNNPVIQRKNPESSTLRVFKPQTSHNLLYFGLRGANTCTVKVVDAGSSKTSVQGITRQNTVILTFYIT
jgi:hypothetical protein